MTQFFAFELDSNIGVSVASANFEGTGEFAILTGTATGAPKFRVFRGGATGVEPPPILEVISDSIVDGLSVGA